MKRLSLKFGASLFAIALASGMAMAQDIKFFTIGTAARLARVRQRRQLRGGQPHRLGGVVARFGGQHQCHHVGFT
jgi:starvation-inducible outer membrane lipoprotein